MIIIKSYYLIFSLLSTSKNKDLAKFKWIYDQKMIFITFMNNSIELNMTQEDVKLYSEEEIKEKIKSEYLHISSEESDNFKTIKELVERSPILKVKSISDEDWQIYNECVEFYSEIFYKNVLNLNTFYH